MDEQEYDPARMQAAEEVTFATSNALNTLMQLLIDKGFITEDELLKKMNDMSEFEDTEEVGLDADKGRDSEKFEE